MVQAPQRAAFPMSELVARTGVPAATIHHYRRLGLVPHPNRSVANRFLYDDRHVRAVSLVRQLRDRRHLPLPTIKRMLPDLLALTEDQALRPETWDLVAGMRLASARRRSPGSRLLQVATEQFSRRGFAGVNVDDLCRAARIAKGSFYRHFRSKEELFIACVEAAAGDVVLEVESLPEDGRDVGAAAHVVEQALEPRLSLLMEMFTRATQRRPGYGPAARRVFSELVRRVGEAVGGENAMATGALVVGLGAAGAFRRVLEPSPLADVDILRAMAF